MTIAIEELEKITTVLMARLKESSDTSLDLTDDLYWHINDKEKYDLNRTPTNLDLGQFSDDLQELRRLLNDKETVIAYDLRRLGNILIAISDSLGKKGSPF